MAEPVARDVPPEDLDENGLDRRGLTDTLEAINGVVGGMAEQARLLGAVEVSGSSPDENVVVRMTRAGRLKHIRLRDGVTRRHDLAALGELIARTIQDTQRRARVEYERAIDEIEQAEFVVTERGLRQRS